MHSDERKPYSTVVVNIITLDKSDVIATSSHKEVDYSSPPASNDGGWTGV